MIRLFCLLILCATGAGVISQPETARVSTFDDIVQIDFYDDAAGFMVYHPASLPADSMRMVVFVHGYGAINPMIFGKWIEHLVGQGHCVVYPRYQAGILSTSPFEFVPNTVEALHAFSSYAEEHLPVHLNSMYLVGHSYGGVIIANIAANYTQFELPKPKTALICQPGTGPFSGGVLESYSAIDPDIRLVVTVGTNDGTVGQAFGVRIFEEAVETPQRILVRQFPQANGDERVDASHYEPYSLDERFDNGISNFTSSKAKRVSNLDQIDINGYWKILDTLITLADENGDLRDAEVLRELSRLGNWSDQTPLRNLEIIVPD